MEGPFGNVDMTEVKLKPHDENLEDEYFNCIKEEPFENEDVVSYIEVETHSGKCAKEEVVDEYKENTCIPFDVITENGSISTICKVNRYS